MSILQVEKLFKSYGDKTLFDHISFTISKKQRIGLIGVNGTGKSTLLKVIAGIDSKESGELIHANDFRIEFLEQHPDFDEDLTVLEEIYYGDSPLMKTLREYEVVLSKLEAAPNDVNIQEKLMKMQQKMDEVNAWEASTVAKTILTRLGITDFSQSVKNLSGGQKKRVAIAKALIQPADLLILDEPTNHLDNETIEWLEGYLSQYRGAILMVTHDRYFLNRVTNTIYELDKGKLYTYTGNYEVFLEKKAEREEQEELSEQKRQNLLRRELAWLRRGAKARTTKQKARVQRAEALINEEVQGPNGKVDIAIGSTRLGKKVIEIEDISKSFGEKQLIKNFSYLVVPNERLGIIGPNGTGKSTLLNILAGRIQPESGTIDIGETVKIGYYTQEHIEMNEELRVINYIKEVAEVISTIDGVLITAEQMLERFLFSRNMQYTYIRKLSGGERRRLYLLRILMQEPNVLFLDEPTNDLDTQTLSILEDYLDQFPGVVIAISHDRYFLDRVVDHLIAFEDGKIRRFQGNYSEYLEVRKEEKAKENIELKKDAPIEQEQKPKTRKKLSYKDQKEWEGLEDRIAALEEKIEMLKNEILASVSDIGKINDLFKEQKKLEEELEQAMERWEELSLLIEEIEQNK